MCDYLQNQVKDLENILEQKSRMVKAFMSELDKNQDENEFLHGRISELEAENKRLRAALENVLLAIDHEDYYNDAVFDEAREALKLAGKEGE